MATSRRFRDDGRTLHDFTEVVLVECPRCSRAATVVPDPGSPTTGGSSAWLSARRLTCGSCGLIRHQPAGSALLGGPFDPYFRLPLALRRPWTEHVVWAFNHDHRSHLLAFVEAELRERCRDEPAGRPSSMIERLPTWFGAAGNRAGIAAVLRSLEDR